jgi:hypothetical protein
MHEYILAKQNLLVVMDWVRLPVFHFPANHFPELRFPEITFPREMRFGEINGSGSIYALYQR